MDEMSNKKIFQFTSEAQTDDTFYVVRFRGTEALNELFSFTIDLICKNTSVDAEQLMKERAELCIQLEDGKTHRFGGYLKSFSQGGFFNGYAYYTAELVPPLYKFTQFRQSTVFLKKNWQAAIKELARANPFHSLPIEFRTSGSYPEPEFAMQYEETLYDYMLWRAEEQGAYFYSAADGSDTIIFADGPNSHTPASEGSIYYSPTSGLEGEKQSEVLTSFTCRHSPTARDVLVKSYNWRDPNRVLTGSAEISQNGFGTIVLSRENAESEEEANRIARIRAEEQKCRSKVFTGVGSVPWLRPGVVFTLERHYNDSFNASYMVTSIEHEGSQESLISLALGIPMHNAPDHCFYRNEFTCIPSRTVFRPERKARRTVISGSIRAFIDGAASGARAETDCYGRYKLVFPFDNSGREKGNASCWIRMATPQSGNRSGLAFALLPGTEVTVSFIDGNPDWPVITGALPNGETGSLNGPQNANFSGIRTPGGNVLSFNDTDKKQGVAIRSPSGHGLTMQAGSLHSISQSTDYDLKAAMVVSEFATLAKNQLCSYSSVTKVINPTAGMFALMGTNALVGAASNVLSSIDTQKINPDDKNDPTTYGGQNPGVMWASEATKLGSVILSTLTSTLQKAKSTGKDSRYHVQLTGDGHTNTSSSSLYVDPDVKKIVAAVVCAVAKYATEGTVGGIQLGKDLKKYDKEIEEESDDKKKKELVTKKLRAKSDFAVSAVCELIPEIVALVLMFINKAKLKKMGGVSIKAVEKNIALSADTHISSIAKKSIFTRAKNENIDGSWGLDEELADFDPWSKIISIGYNDNVLKTNDGGTGFTHNANQQAFIATETDVHFDKNTYAYDKTEEHRVIHSGRFTLQAGIPSEYGLLDINTKHLHAKQFAKDEDSEAVFSIEKGAASSKLTMKTKSVELARDTRKLTMDDTAVLVQNNKTEMKLEEKKASLKVDNDDPILDFSSAKGTLYPSGTLEIAKLTLKESSISGTGKLELQDGVIKIMG